MTTLLMAEEKQTKPVKQHRRGSVCTYVRIMTGGSARPFTLATSIGFELDKQHSEYVNNKLENVLRTMEQV